MKTYPKLVLVAAKADMREAHVKRADASGRSHNEWGFGNRMLDVTMALINAK